MKAAAPGTRLTVGLCLLAFVTMFTYAVASSAAQSLFLSAYGSRKLPWVWLGVGLASALATLWLSRMSQRLDVLRLFALACRMSALSLVLLLLLYAAAAPGVAYALYVWKEIYIIVLVELFWTFANVVFGMRSASRTYGLFCAAGSLGSVVGNQLLGLGAGWVGTASSMAVIAPLLLIISTGSRRLSRNLPVPEPNHTRPRAGLDETVRTLRGSSILPWLMVLVAGVQGTLTLLDYRLSSAVEQLGHTEQARTQALTQLYVIINAASFALQLCTGALLRTLGMGRALLLVPFLLCLPMLWAQLSRSYAAAATCLVVGKCLDYSLFRAAKELLYIPLSYAEKTQGKALVDIFTYRTAKAGVSLLLLALPLVGLGRHTTGLLMWGGMALWWGAVAAILRRYGRLRALQRGAAPAAAPAAKPG